MGSKLQVTPTKLQVTRSKLTSLIAETNKFQLTNMLFITFECSVNGSLQMAVIRQARFSENVCSER